MANRFTFPRETAFDANGNPLAGARLYFYEAGTTNPDDSFADEALTIANTNPVVADSAGRFGDIFLQAIDYKVILKDAADVTIWTADPVSGTVIASGDKFIPSQQSPADMTVLLGPGTIWNVVTKTRLVLAAQTTALITAPATNPRNDIVYIDRVTGIVGVATGTEAVSPVDPAIPDGKLPVARARLANTTVEITADLIDDIRELELLGAGTTAVRDTGVADGQVPLMDATGYPAADGRQINNVDVPRGYIDGLILSNNAIDADHDIDIAPGVARDGGNAANLNMSAALTKQLDAVWAVGANQGGSDQPQLDGAQTVTFTDNGASDDFVTIDSGIWADTVSVGDTLVVVGGVNAGSYQITAATTTRIDVATGSFSADANSASAIHTVKNNTWYHMWQIGRSDTDVVDALFSESATAPAMPANYDQKRRIGAVLTDGSADIVGFTQAGDVFMWKAHILDRFTLPASLHETVALSIPPVPCIAAIINATGSGSSNRIAWFHNLDIPDAVPTTIGVPMPDFAISSTLWTSVTPRFSVQTDGLGNVRVSVDGTAGWSNFRIATLGWIDPRGRNV